MKQIAAGGKGRPPGGATTLVDGERKSKPRRLLRLTGLPDPGSQNQTSVWCTNTYNYDTLKRRVAHFSSIINNRGAPFLAFVCEKWGLFSAPDSSASSNTTFAATRDRVTYSGDDKTNWPSENTVMTPTALRPTSRNEREKLIG